MKAKFVVTAFGENLEAAWNQAQKAIQEKVGTSPAEVEVLQHPHRFGPQKFADRFIDSMISGKHVRGISAGHNELVEKARAAIVAGKAVGFPLHGGNAKTVRDTFSAKRVQGEAYMFFGIVETADEVGVSAPVPEAPTELKSDGSDPVWAEPKADEPEDWAKLEA